VYGQRRSRARIYNPEEIMANEAVKDAIVAALKEAEGGSVTGASNADLRKELGVECPSSMFQRALGSLIQAGTVRRHRPEMTGISFPDERPITLTLVKK
jgi:hypothetical protein